MSTKRRAQRVYQEPIKYTVGSGPNDALTQEQYDDIFTKIVDWFQEYRKTEDLPAKDVRYRLKCCMEGTKLSGEKWLSHWNSTLATRIRMMCKYDIEKMQPIRSKEKEYEAKEAVKRAKKERQLGKGDPRAPDSAQVKYGDNPQNLLNKKELRRWHEVKKGYLTQYPELATVASEAELDFLCDIQIRQERQRLRLLEHDKTLHERDMLDLSKLMVETKKALGIHPDQLVKRVEQDEQGSIAEAVKKIGGFDRDHRLRERFFAEELLQLYKMYHTPSPNPDSGGYQLDNIKLMAHTKCPTCKCAGCGLENFRGLAIEEIEAYLVKEDVLRPDDQEVDGAADSHLSNLGELDDPATAGGMTAAQAADSDNGADGTLPGGESGLPEQEN